MSITAWLVVIPKLLPPTETPSRGIAQYPPGSWMLTQFMLPVNLLVSSAPIERDPPGAVVWMSVVDEYESNAKAKTC